MGFWSFSVKDFQAYYTEDKLDKECEDKLEDVLFKEYFLKFLQHLHNLTKWNAA